MKHGTLVILDQDPNRRRSQFTAKEPFKSRLLDDYRRKQPNFAVL